MGKGNKMGRNSVVNASRDEQHSTRPTTAMLTNHYLVFNDSYESGHPCLIAILRLYNPSGKSDIFYKLYSDSYRVCFHVKSWKGRVRRNSFVEIVINTNVLPPDVRYSHRYTPAYLTPQQLSQTRFTLEINEYVPKWNPHRKPTYNTHHHHGQVGGVAGRVPRNLKVEFQCTTRDSFWRSHRVERVPEPLLSPEVSLRQRNVGPPSSPKHISPIEALCEPRHRGLPKPEVNNKKRNSLSRCKSPLVKAPPEAVRQVSTLSWLTSLCSTVLCGLLGGVAFWLILRFGFEVEH